MVVVANEIAVEETADNFIFQQPNTEASQQLTSSADAAPSRLPCNSAFCLGPAYASAPTARLVSTIDCFTFELPLSVMADADRPAGKRSRFDQTEPEPRKSSRFDRRSRSPPTRRFEARERSPLSKDTASQSNKSPIDAAAAAGMAFFRLGMAFVAEHQTPASRRCVLTTTRLCAAAAAARINAQLQARKGIQHVDVPPILKPEQSPTPPASIKATTSSAGSGVPRKVDGAMYVADGDYIKDIEVNDLRNRYILTKISNQQMVITLDAPLILQIHSSLGMRNA